MKNYLLSGIIVLTYAMSTPAFPSDTATLTITGRVTMPTCSTDVVNRQLQQRCGNTLFQLNAQNAKKTSSARGVVTEMTHLPGDTARQIVLNRYD